MIAYLTVLASCAMREDPAWHLGVIALLFFWRASDLLLAALKLRTAQLELATAWLRLMTQETRP